LNSSERQELLQLVQNHVNLGFILLETYQLSLSMGHMEHAYQALKNAGATWETATGFLNRMTDEEADQFRPKLQELGSAIQSHASKLNTESSGAGGGT
jgi:hypothetical protein